VELFSDEDLTSIFTFINSIHNNLEYKPFAYSFLKIFNESLNSKISKYYNLGLRINKLCKNNKIFLRIIILILYNNMNISLSKLEERFCEFKFKPISNQNGINQVSNINNNNINNNNNQNNIINRIRNSFFIRRNNAKLSDNDKDKLTMLKESFLDVRNQFLIF